MHFTQRVRRPSWLEGFHGDVNATYPVGEINEESRNLIDTTRRCLDEAIKICKPGTLFRDLGKIMYAFFGKREPHISFDYLLANQSPGRTAVVLSDNTQVMGYTGYFTVCRTSLTMPKIKQLAR